MEQSFFEFRSPVYRDPPRTDILHLARPYIFTDGQLLYVCPATGWPFDGASIPRFFWRVVGPPLRARYRRGALGHDAIYKGVMIVVPYNPRHDPGRIAQALLRNPNEIPALVLGRPRVTLSKDQADGLLHDMAIWNGTPAWTARTLRLGVDNVFGRRAWKREHAKYEHLAGVAA